MIRNLVERGLSRMDMRTAERDEIIEAVTQVIQDTADQIVQDRLRTRPVPDAASPYARRAKASVRKGPGPARARDDPIDP